MAPRVSGIWRLELQKRGAPHFHLILFNLPYLGFEQLRRWWEEIIGWNQERESVPHVFVRIERIDSMKKLMCYVSKYCAKVEKAPQARQDAGDALQSEGVDGAGGGALLDSASYLTAERETVGRWWGIINREGLPLAVVEVAKMCFGAWALRAKQVARAIFQPKNPKWDWSLGFTLYMDCPDSLFYELIREAGEEGCFSC